MRFLPQNSSFLVSRTANGQTAFNVAALALHGERHLRHTAVPPCLNVGL
jgi:hypothetical protein